MKVAIFVAVLFTTVIAAPVSEDAIVPEFPKLAPLEIFAQESSAVADPAPCTDELLHSGGASGSTFTCKGPGPRAGHYITYAITVPSHCTSSSKCGVILNIHGQGMNSQTIEVSTGVKAAALAGKKYIVINPEDYDSNWEFRSMGQHDDAALIGEFLTKALEVYEDIVDTNRVHSTGFSAGAISTYSLLCKHSDKICSVAGIGFNPLMQFLYVTSNPPRYFPGLQVCFNQAMGGTGPTHKRSIMVQQSTKDPYFQAQAKNAMENTVTAVKDIYGMSGDGKKLSKGAGVDWTRYTGGGVTFEAASYEFSNGDDLLKGHCIPVKDTQTSTAMKYPNSVFCGADAAGNAAGYTWGEEVIKFFEAHPCDEGA